MKFFLLLLLSFSAHARTLLFIGDSLTEGYGLSTEEAYPAQLENLLKAKNKSDVKIVNGGISGSTTANAVQRVKWYLKIKPTWIVLALGANDGLRGLDVKTSQKNLTEAVHLAQQNQIKVFIAPMILPRNYGKPYRESFEKMYRDLSKIPQVTTLPFLLEGVGGIPEMNQADGIHPNVQGHKKIAETMLKVLEKYL